MTLQIAPQGRHLLRRYGLYASRARGTWKKRPALSSRAPEGWCGHGEARDDGPACVFQDLEVGRTECKSAWVRLLAKMYEVDAWACPDCDGRISVIAVIYDPAEIYRATRAALGIAECMGEKGQGPPDD